MLVHVCMCTCVHTCVKARLTLMSSSVTLYVLFFSDKLSHWTRSSLLQPDGGTVEP